MPSPGLREHVARAGGLASNADVARMLGLTRQRIQQLRKTDPAFPAPIGETSQGPVWVVSHVEHYKTRRQARRRREERAA